MRILRGHETGKSVYGLAFSPDGERLASCGGDGIIRLWDLAPGTSRALHPALSSFVAFSPDGGRLACATWEWIWVTDLATGAVVSIRVRRFPSSTRAVFSPDGQTLLVVDDAVRLCDPSSGEVRATWSDSSVVLGCLALDGSGTLVATAHSEPCWKRSRRSHDYAVWLRRYPTGERLRRFDEVTNEVTSLAFSPDGHWLAAACSPTLWVWEVATGKVVLRQRPDTRHFKGVAFSPDGHWLAAAHNDATVRLYAVPGWAERETFDWRIGPIVSVCFAPDSMRAAAGSKRGRIVVWDVDP